MITTPSMHKTAEKFSVRLDHNDIAQLMVLADLDTHVLGASGMHM